LIRWQPALGGHDATEGLPPLVPAEPQSTARLLREIPLLLGLAALIAFLVKTFVAQAFYIPSESMVPQLEVNDRVVVSKLSYRLHEPRRGDIIVFDDPRDLDESDDDNVVEKFVRGLAEAVGVRQPSTDEFIKRVIGLPGETVEGRGGRVYVDGRLLHEPYLPQAIVTSDFPATSVPQGTLWVMGDNRSNSQDSRSFGPVRRSTVVGRTVLRVWPPGSASFL
jgi:signal peptidase I